jgi:hypothetical protein
MNWTDDEFAAANAAAEEIFFDGILPIISETVAAASFDSGALNYSLWALFTRLLAEDGWPPEILTRDAAYLVAHQTCEVVS